MLIPTWQLLRDTVKQALNDDVPRLGAALSFYTMLSLGPLMVLLLTAAGWIYGADAARTEIHSAVLRIAGSEEADSIQSLLSSPPTAQSGLLAAILNIVVLLVGASSIFVQLQDAFNIIWKTPPKTDGTIREMVRKYSLSFLMLMGMALALILSATITAALAIADRMLHLLPHFMAGLIELANLGISLGIISLIFGLMFKFVPDRKIAWGDVWMGAVLTSILFNIGQFSISFYLSHTGLMSSYGAAGSLVALLVWVYYTAQISFFGAAFTCVYAHRYGSYRNEALPAAAR